MRRAQVVWRAHAHQPDHFLPAAVDAQPIHGLVLGGVQLVVPRRGDHRGDEEGADEVPEPGELRGLLLLGVEPDPDSSAHRHPDPDPFLCPQRLPELVVGVHRQDRDASRGDGLDHAHRCPGDGGDHE